MSFSFLGISQTPSLIFCSGPTETGKFILVVLIIFYVPGVLYVQISYRYRRFTLGVAHTTLFSNVADPLVFGLLDSNPDSLVRGTDPDPAIIKQKK